MRGFFILLCAVLMAFGSAGSAVALTVNFVDGTTYNTEALTGFATYGDMMKGMTVIATFSDRPEDTQLWADTASGSGGVYGSGSNWSLIVSGDTFVDQWTLTVSNGSSLTNLFLDAGTGNAVFDVLNGDHASPGSANGKPFNTTAYAGPLTATYADLVGIGGKVYDDLYRTLKLDFGDSGFSGSMTFTADTDNLSIPGDLNPANPVPEPATMLLLGTGLMGIAGFGRKKLFKKS